MDLNGKTVISFSEKRYDDIIRNLEAVSDKSDINTLNISQTSIIELKESVFNEFTNLIDLNLSNCTIYNINHTSVLKHLTHLKSINFSNNAISSIDNRFFANNERLEIINFKNNLLDNVGQVAFSHLQHLETFDLSYNRFSELKHDFLTSGSLKNLYLNNNQIEFVTSTCFYRIPNLTRLILDNNKINYFESDVFKYSVNLQYLSVNHNQIQLINETSFWNLTMLTNLYLKNNRITQKISTSIFFMNKGLTKLDLSGNKITNLEKRAFNDCKDLKSLCLRICCKFDIVSIDHLAALAHFELFYEPQGAFFLRRSFWNKLLNKQQLTVLKLIFQKVDMITLCTFSPLTNLEYLHIECKEHNSNIKDIHFNTCFDNLPKLEKLVLKKLNSYAVTHFCFRPKKLTYLALVGVKNTLIDHMFKKFELLEYLNLSFSEIRFITESAFDQLINLEHLKLNDSKLRSINRSMFKNNTKLRILNVSNCRIRYIADFAFRNLSNLEKLDLRDHLLPSITENMFSGLNKDTCNILL